MSEFTTLITFMLQATPDVFSVELFGSWDNFDKSYHLTRDKRAGAGQWRGCHTFENITCDGDPSNSTLHREGALMMGGTYWYYYLLNGTTEFHDPNEPTTSFCPSLPGQSVNILEVPIQARQSILSSLNGSTSSFDALVFTLDPKDKYMPLRRAATTSAVHERARLLDPTNADTTTYVKRLRQIEDLSEPESSCEGTPLRRQRSISSMFSKLRRTKSAGSSVKGSSTNRTGTSWSRRLISRASLSRKGKVEHDMPEVPKVPKIPEDLLCMAPCTKVGNPHKSSKFIDSSGTGSRCLQQVTTHSTSVKAPSLKSIDGVRSMLSTLPNNSGNSGDRPKSSRGSGKSFVANFSSLAERGCASNQSSQSLHSASAALELAERPDLHLKSDDEREEGERLAPTAREHEVHNLPLALTNENIYTDNEDSYQTYTESSAYSTAPSEYFSPCLASNTTASGQMSPVLVQAYTPDLLGLNDEEIRWKRDSDPDPEEIYNNRFDSPQMSASPPPTDPNPRPHDDQMHKRPISGFQGYSLPLHDQASTVTIRKLPSFDFMAPKKLTHRPSMQHLVHSWDDGAEQRRENLSTMMEEMAYLGDLIN